MDIITRIKNLENLVKGLIEDINKIKFYLDADIAGVRKNVNDLNEEIYPEWNPDGFAYFAGEKIIYKGKYYRCIQAHPSQEAWNPEDAASLWAEIGNPYEEWPEWIQPTGAHNAYAKGDKVSHNEKHWISDIDANVYEPGVSSWTEQ